MIPALFTRLRNLILILLIPCISFTAHGLDADGNGVSDVWESRFPEAAAEPNADHDGDGVSNRDEGLAWTDPDDAASILRPQNFEHLPDEIRFKFDEQRWLRDAVFESTNLTDWRRDGNPVTGEGGVVSVSRPAPGERGFYRIARYAALDSDGDGLDNREEEELGTSPTQRDTDGDGVSDDREFLNGTDPLSNTDSDGDELPDDWERWIILHDANDNVTTLADVDNTTDFDGDGVLDAEEFALGTSPVLPLRNIVFFLTEDQGPDLGCLGTTGLGTPNLDALGNSGVLFERAFALSPVCSPSKMALFTGTYPHTNSAYRNVHNYGVDFPLKGDPSDLRLGGVHEDLPTLIEILRAHGWHTAISSKSHVQPVRKFPYHQGHNNPGSPAAATTVINNTVAAAGNRPFFLCFNIASPHLPFRNIAKINGLWDESGGLLGDGGVTNVDPNEIAIPDSLPDVPGVRQDIADYYGAIEVVDSIYAAMRDALDTEGLLDNTLIVFSGDHGNGLARFKQSIYGLHVPLLIDGPGVTGERRISEPVSHLDLAPTFFDFAGISVPSTMLGKSLWPILSGDSGFPDRDTVLTACHEKYDARAVTDGRYYYVRNIRQVAGATLASPGKALNQDQYLGGEPWFNRSYDATLDATSSPQLELLRQLVEGELPDEELYDLDNDLWCTVNLIDDPALSSIRSSLAAQLANWRIATEDYNLSPDEITRRGEQFVDITPPGNPDFDDSFDGRAGALDADPDWALAVSGDSGADFTLGGDQVDAPGGPLTLAVREGSELASGDGFTVSVETGFQGAGVASGVAFGIVSEGDSFSFWQFMLADGRSTSGGLNKDLRLFRVVQGAQQTPALVAEDELTDYPIDGAAFTVTVSGREGSSTVDLLIQNPDESVYYQQNDFNLGAPVPHGGRFGITTWSSGSSFFDNFRLNFN